VVFDPTDFNRLHFVLSRNPAEKWPKPFAQRRSYEGSPIFRAEDAMVVGADVGHTGYSAVPSGLVQFQILPGVETPGYFHMFLRNNGASPRDNPTRFQHARTADFRHTRESVSFPA
jgi:hypothetical protein